MTSSRHLRVLCLHGYHGSGALLRRQMAPLAAALSPRIELVYVDAPSLSSGDFGWWHDRFSGWERTRDWAVELLRTGPRVDGVFGFSQDAALTGLLAGLCEDATSPVSFEFAIPLIIEHRGGHVIPAVTASIVDFLARFCHEDVSASGPGALRGGR